mgnify:CR=1 FL=1
MHFAKQVALPLVAGAVAENLTVPEMWMLAPTVTSQFRWTSRRYPLLHLSRQWSLKTQRQRRAAWRSWQRHGAVMRATSGREIWYGFVVTVRLISTFSLATHFLIQI